MGLRVREMLLVLESVLRGRQGVLSAVGWWRRARLAAAVGAHSRRCSGGGRGGRVVVIPGLGARRLYMAVRIGRRAGWRLLFGMLLLDSW